MQGLWGTPKLLLYRRWEHDNLWSDNFRRSIHRHHMNNEIKANLVRKMFQNSLDSLFQFSARRREQDQIHSSQQNILGEDLSRLERTRKVPATLIEIIVVHLTNTKWCIQIVLKVDIWYSFNSSTFWDLRKIETNWPNSFNYSRGYQWIMVS